MTEPAVVRTGAFRVGARAARTLVAELARRPGPRAALLVGAAPDSAALAAATDALLPTDTLTVVAPDRDRWRDRVAGLGRWFEDRVRLVDSLAAADPVDVVVVAEPMTGTAEETRDTLDRLGKLLTPGGVLVAAAPAVPGAGSGAAAELGRQQQLYGVGADLVLLNPPPVRVHRLRWTPADPALAERLAPVDRPSSVPLTRRLHVDSHGVAAAGILLGLAGLAGLARRPGSARRRGWRWLLPAAALPVAAFFRDPPRDPPEDRSLVVAASDGTVLSVERVTEDRFSGDGSSQDYLRIAVFLALWDVHVNRAPVAGEVVDYFLEDGGHAPAMTPDGEHNVAAYTVLRTTRGRVGVAQRTGVLARRIVQRAPVGALLARGERFGLIRFGSRTDVYLPADAAEALVAVGDRVTGGTTALARWH